jgi:Tfp pilus assembly protein PilO
MKVSMRDKKILLMFIGILVFFVGWYFGYRPQMEKADQIEDLNGALEEQLQDLLELAANKDFYVSETASIKDKISEYISEFPADVRPEDGIVLANKMENELGFQITNVGVGEKEFVASLDGSSEEDLAQSQDQTMSEQANAQTQEQIDNIEGTDSQAEEALQNASDAAAADQSSDSQVPVLYRTQVTLQFNGTYAELKKAVLYVADQSGRMTLDNVNASYDTSTGNLTGTIIVNIFSMSGTERTYTEPDAGSVAYGTDNIFGTVEQNAPAEASDQNTDAQADTAETEAQPAQ